MDSEQETRGTVWGTLFPNIDYSFAVLRLPSNITHSTRSPTDLPDQWELAFVGRYTFTSRTAVIALLTCFY